MNLLYITVMNIKKWLHLYILLKKFVKQLQIEEKYQKLKIDTKKDQYYYEIDYTQKPSSYFTNLNVNFNLNNKDYITITLNIELNYISPIVWMCLSLGIYSFIFLIYVGKGYIIICYWRKKQREELNVSVIKSIEQQEEEEREAEEMRKKQIKEIEEKKKRQK